jgi:FkbM family methyltransferase
MTISKTLNYIGNTCCGLARKFDAEYHYNHLYGDADPLELKRVDYPLSKNSVVVDIGGMNGDWASRIFCRYCCRIDIYEPTPEMVEQARWNFKCNPHVAVYPHALSDVKGNLKLYGDPLKASLFGPEDKPAIEVPVLIASEVFGAYYPYGIDLLKINAEGAEYNVLPDLIKNYGVEKIRDIQIQFHKTIDGKPIEHAREKCDAIRKDLLKTHQLTYCYEWAFENWRLK